MSSRCTRIVASMALALSASLVATEAMAATIDPYTSTTTTTPTGYDVSYPQCGGVTPPGAFGIVGVNGGRPFSTNSCLNSEYGWATSSGAPLAIKASLYINTGYSGAYGRKVTPACAASKPATGSSAEKQAWAIGCSEAETSFNYAGQQGATNVAMWWLDVETANSWSSSNLSLNQYAIQGATDTLVHKTNLPVGVYSSASMWTTVTGGNNYTPVGIAADWEAAGGSCSTPFTSSPVWLVQSTTSGFDSDQAC